MVVAEDAVQVDDAINPGFPLGLGLLGPGDGVRVAANAIGYEEEVQRRAINGINVAAVVSAIAVDVLQSQEIGGLERGGVDATNLLRVIERLAVKARVDIDGARSDGLLLGKIALKLRENAGVVSVLDDMS